MINPIILDYIKSEKQKGTSDVLIRSGLSQSGWKSEDVDDAFKFASTALNENSKVNISGFTTTESKYPITTLWIFKYPIIMIAISVTLFFIDTWVPYFVVAIPYFLIANPLIKKNFHFSLDSQYLTVKQGVFNKQQRNLPYGVIQNVLVKQDLFDRLFGIANLTVENAAEAGGSGISKWFSKSQNQQNQADFVGSKGNKMSIPGLKKADAEALKTEVLAKMKENPLQDTQSGL